MNIKFLLLYIIIYIIIINKFKFFLTFNFYNKYEILKL